MKMKKWKIALLVLAIALFAAWYAFRPERLVVNHRLNEGFPVTEAASSAETIESGTFYGVMHPTTGTATIYRLADGSRILRFTNFGTSNGPDVHVYLVADDAKDTEAMKRAAFIGLGTIKGNIGDQNYASGADLDLSRYRTVSIGCKRFAINFGAAPLRADHVMSQN
jgi:Electron transfer DM13